MTVDSSGCRQKVNGRFGRHLHCLLVLGCLLFAAAAPAAGSLLQPRNEASAPAAIGDSSFGDGGVVVAGPVGSASFGKGVALQPDGKLLVVGYTTDAEGDGLLLVRVNPDGSPDTGFGRDKGQGVQRDGFVIYRGGFGYDYGHGVAVQADGKILVVGETFTGSDFDLILLRFNADGSRDLTFNNNTGSVVVRSEGYDCGQALVLQPDGKIVVTGQVYNQARGGYDLIVLRYNADGSTDHSFGIDRGAGSERDGYLVYNDGADNIGYALALQTDGKIVVAGETSILATYATEPVIMRFDATGMPDNTFGNGTHHIEVSTPQDWATARSVAIQADGKVLVAVALYNGADNDALLLRFNASGGSLDTTFGTDGAVLYIGSGSGNDCGKGLALQADGKIVMAGEWYNGDTASADLMVLRYHADGTPDVSFADAGFFAYNGSDNGDDNAFAALVQPDGKIVAVGSTFSAAGDRVLLVRLDGSPLLPVAVTGAANDITDHSATLVGTVNANGDGTIVTFEFGSTPAYGASVVALESPVSGSDAANVSASVTDLIPGATYHFRLKAENTIGIAFGNDVQFTAAKLSQSIDFAALPEMVVSTSGTLTATATSALAVGFSSLTPDVCSVNDRTVTGLTVGTCTIAADQAGNDTYAAALREIRSFAVLPAGATLTVTIGGFGTVTSLPSGIACTSGDFSGCSATFASGTAVSLIATADWKSVFSGWGVPCSGTGQCSVTLAADRNITAVFTALLRVRIPGATAADFPSLQDAYAHAGNNATLRATNFSFPENLTFDREIAIGFAGGFSDDFQNLVGFTTVHGLVTIERGTLTVSNLMID